MIARRGDRVGTTLVTDRSDAQALNALAEHDALTALRRGLAEYMLEALKADTGGRPIRLESVLWGWADFERRGQFPAAYISTSGETNYAKTATARGSGFARAQAGVERLDIVADVATTLEVRLYCKDEAQRAALVHAVEAASFPVDWLDSIRVRLAYYHGAFASYDLASISYEDSPEDAAAMLRVAAATFRATVPLVVARAAKAAITPRVSISVSPDAEIP